MTDWQNRIVRYGVQPADQFTANPKNPRKHPAKQRQAVTGSLDAVGVIAPVVINVRTGRMIDGHLRVELALANGNAELPFVEVDLSEEEEALALATFDFTTVLAEYDPTMLDSLLEGVNTDNAALQSMIADMAESVGLYTDQAEPVEDEGAQLDKAEELREKWQTERGQLWVIPSAQGGEHRLLCGDSTNAEDVSRLMAGEKARLVVTSPPYNQNLDTFKPSGMQKESPSFVNRMASSYADSMSEDEYQKQQIDLLEMLPHYMTDDGSIFYNHKIRYRNKSVVSPYEWLSKLSYPIRQEIIWDRGSSITLNARMFIPADERIYWMRVGNDFVFNDTVEVKSWSTVWEIAARNDVQISAAFATELPVRCIRAASMPQDVVIEPYGGSGTTMVACEQLGRQCRMIEIEPKYVAVILERMAALGLKPTLSD